ncbi:hypothetical protein DN730_09950 [Marinomonas piezotolerans]|uniref:Uncharacterized protein n=1 Tax=Marinomonas piezotolerans TaxID=2213058 RepID=A0A370UA68_9GAMM|nr:hypothetical protein [Marinomonas piezotolerans]RDL44696.1 hypothetical protein DN730_09950 [Marinomonas piezotolerans]
MLPYIQEAEVSIISNDPSVVSRSRSGRKHVRNLERQHWLLDIKWPDYLRDKANEITVQLDAMQGQAETADVIHPVQSYHPNAGADFTATSGVAAGADSVAVSGTGALTIGHLVRFRDHSKVYRVIALSGSTVTLYPKLRRALSAAETITTQSVPITVTRINDELTAKQKGPLSSLSASFEEML